MSKERADFGLEIPDFQPRTKPPVDKAEVREAAERTGFTARHAPAPAAPVVPAQAFDARSLRRSTKTAKLNIAVTEEVRHRFWTLAQSFGTSDGQEALNAMMDAFEARLDGRA